MANTPLGYPYPVGTDRVMDGDDAIASLALSVDSRVGVWAAGAVTVTVPTGGTFATLAVTFPAGRFSAAPFCFANVRVNNPTTVQGGVAAAAPTATGFTVTAVRNTSGTVDLFWSAVQIATPALAAVQPASDEETPGSTRTATCQVDGCPNAGIAIDLFVPDGAGVACGVCAQPITDVVA
jgi:hypothetical protein